MHLLIGIVYLVMGPNGVPANQAAAYLLQKLEQLRPLAAGFQKNSDLRHPQYCHNCKARLALEGWKVCCRKITPVPVVLGAG